MNSDVLQPALGDEDMAWEFLLQHGLVRNKACSLCGAQLDYCWERDIYLCSSRPYCMNEDHVVLSLQAANRFSKVSYSKVLRLLYGFASEKSVRDIKEETGVSRNIIEIVKQEIQDSIIFYLLKDTFTPEPELGGFHRVVEIDEAKLGRTKHNRGKPGREQWTLGMIERGSRRCYFVEVPDRSTPTLFPIILQHVKPGSTIITDGWSSYNILGRTPEYIHKWVNHSISFKSPEGETTNSIEGSWFYVRRTLLRHRKIVGGLRWFMFKQNFGAKSSYETLLALMEILSDTFEKRGWLIKRNTGEIIQLKQTDEGKKKRSAEEKNTSERSADSSSPQYSSVQLNVMVKDSPVNERDSRSANATVYIDINPYVGGNDQIVIIGAAAGGGLLLIILVIVVFVFVIRRKKAKSGSKELTFVNPTAYTGKDGRVVTTDGGYVSSEPDNIILKDMVDIKRNANLVPYSQDELGTGYTDTPIYDLADPAYLTTSHPNYLNTRDKTVPHKMSVSTVLSDMRNDVQVSAIPHRLTGSVTRTGSYESVHVFGSEGGGEGDAVIDAHSLFNKLSEIDDDVSVINNKSTHFLGDQDSAFSSLGSGSSNAGDQVTTPYHTEYLQDWKPAFQSVGKICEGMLRNKQFAYKSNTSSSRHTSAENISPNLNAGSIPRDSPSANHHASNGTISTNHHASNGNISTSDRVMKSRDGGSTPRQHPGSVVSSYQDSREDVISSRPSNVSGHSNSPARSVGSC